MRIMDRIRVRKIVPNCSACPTRIDVLKLRMPKDMRNILTDTRQLLSIIPCIIFPKPLKITLIERDNNVKFFVDANWGELRAMIANVAAIVPIPIYVKRPVFVIPIDCLAIAGSRRAEVILSMPMVSKVIETCLLYLEIE
jgi:hypothetical protein